MTPLTHADIMRHLRALRREEESRTLVAAWARDQRLQDEAMGDPLLLKMLEYLAAADFQGSSRTYLYGPSDFEAWETELHWGTPGEQAAQPPLEPSSVLIG